MMRSDESRSTGARLAQSRPGGGIGTPGPAGAALREVVEPTVTGLGYELVEVQRAAGGVLRVTVDTIAPAGAIGLDDCERVSRQLVPLLAVERVDYERLEVSSPGLDRPLVAARDFVRFAGCAVHVELRAPLQGRRRFQGRLLGLAGEAGGETVRLALGGSDAEKRPARGRAKPAPAAAPAMLELPLADIEKARLIPQVRFGRGREDERKSEQKNGPADARTNEGRQLSRARKKRDE
jgi:ribosome maturation factor RimP